MRGLNNSKWTYKVAYSPGHFGDLEGRNLPLWVALNGALKLVYQNGFLVHLVFVYIVVEGNLLLLLLFLHLKNRFLVKIVDLLFLSWFNGGSFRGGSDKRLQLFVLFPGFLVLNKLLIREFGRNRRLILLFQLVLQLQLFLLRLSLLQLILLLWVIIYLFIYYIDKSSSTCWSWKSSCILYSMISSVMSITWLTILCSYSCSSCSSAYTDLITLTLLLFYW